MKKLKLNIAVFLALLIAISGCQKDDIVTEPITETEESQFQEGMIQLGKKLENPYTVENMRKAYQNLSDNQLKSANVNESYIDVTHLYVRFLPKNFEELEVLKQDTTLTLFDFPLDYEIEEGGTYYHDPELPDTTITWQYCAVEKVFSFPNVQYEVLAELFLPETMEDSINLKSTDNWTFWDDLEVEALRITDNLYEDPKLKSTMGRDKFEPKGTILLTDDSGLGTNGLEGLYVIARSWFTTKHNYTNSAGYFKINHTFKGHCNYYIKWERGDFDIRSGNWGQAYYNGPRSSGDWNLTIGRGGISWCYGHIHRAAYIYYYRNGNYGIQSPPRQGGVLNQRLHIGAMDKAGTSHYYDFNKFFTTPQVKIYCKYGSSWISSVDIFGTTIHELAHASHWELGYSTKQYLVDWIFRKALMPESWASCVEHVITSDIYSATSYSDWNNKQNESYDDFSDGYTPLFIDLIDNINQRQDRQNRGFTDFMDYPIDRVDGYTLSQLETILDRTYIDLGIYSASQLETIYESFAISIYKNKLRDTYVNSTEGFINELFSNYY